MPYPSKGAWVPWKGLEPGHHASLTRRRTFVMDSFQGMNPLATVKRRSAMPKREQAPALQRSPEILHAHQVTAFAVHLCVEDAAFVRRYREPPLYRLRDGG